MDRTSMSRLLRFPLLKCKMLADTPGTAVMTRTGPRFALGLISRHGWRGARNVSKGEHITWCQIYLEV